MAPGYMRNPLAIKEYYARSNSALMKEKSFEEIRLLKGSFAVVASIGFGGLIILIAMLLKSCEGVPSVAMCHLTSPLSNSASSSTGPDTYRGLITMGNDQPLTAGRTPKDTIGEILGSSRSGPTSINAISNPAKWTTPRNQTNRFNL